MIVMIHLHTVFSLSLAMKEARYRYGNSFEQVEDVMGVAQPVRFNSEFCRGRSLKP